MWVRENKFLRNHLWYYITGLSGESKTYKELPDISKKFSANYSRTHTSTYNILTESNKNLNANTEQSKHINNLTKKLPAKPVRNSRIVVNDNDRTTLDPVLGANTTITVAHDSLFRFQMTLMFISGVLVSFISSAICYLLHNPNKYYVDHNRHPFLPTPGPTAYLYQSNTHRFIENASGSTRSMLMQP